MLIVISCSFVEGCKVDAKSFRRKGKVKDNGNVKKDEEAKKEGGNKFGGKQIEACRSFDRQARAPALSARSECNLNHR